VRPLDLAGLILVIVALLALDLQFFARGREPTFREGVAWSLGWLALSLLAALPLWALEGGEKAVNYTTVYLIERSLSLDNLFVFLVLFAYFAVPAGDRGRLLFLGIVLALVLRGLAILGGVALIQEFEPLLYVLGILLIVLALRLLRGVEESADPEANLFVRAARRFYPRATPWFLCLGAIAVADITFAIDSIPAAFGITRDSAVIWMGNAFALMGMRALFVLVESLIARFRFLDQTIAIVLALVGVKLLLDELVHIGAPVSLAIVLVAFAIGITASVVGDRRADRRDEPGYSRPTS
jgi:tellurite resistance protein TerC